MCKKYPVQCSAACGVEVPREKVWFFVFSLVTPIYLDFQKKPRKCSVELVAFL